MGWVVSVLPALYPWMAHTQARICGLFSGGLGSVEIEAATSLKSQLTLVAGRRLCAPCFGQ